MRYFKYVKYVALAGLLFFAAGKANAQVRLGVGVGVGPVVGAVGVEPACALRVLQLLPLSLRALWILWPGLLSRRLFHWRWSMVPRMGLEARTGLLRSAPVGAIVADGAADIVRDPDLGADLLHAASQEAAVSIAKAVSTVAVVDSTVEAAVFPQSRRLPWWRWRT